ncbi:MAG: DUF3576 domain-containing protein [Pseudomonadota bacterium]
MIAKPMLRIALLLLLIVGMTGCGAISRIGGTGQPGAEGSLDNVGREDERAPESTLADLFRPQPTENIVPVNKYIWSASLEVLDFLPIQSVDPFTGVIVTGYGTPPNGGRAYRATILIDDPALEARSLNVALQTRSGPASAATVRAVEDAILSRARQLRIADNRL